MNLLFRSCLRKVVYPDTRLPDFTDEDVQKTFDVAKQYDLSHIVGWCLGDSAPDYASNAAQTAIWRYAQYSYESQRIFSVFERENIDYIPLKGLVIRSFYPQEWLRTSADIDILVRPGDKRRAARLLCDELGYKWENRGDLREHDILRFQSGLCLELHPAVLFGSKQVDSILDQVWDRAVKREGRRHDMDDDMFAFYFIAHFAKHVVKGACGIRPVIDYRLMSGRYDFHNSLVAEAGLGGFADAVQSLSECWFDGKERSDADKTFETLMQANGICMDHRRRMQMLASDKGRMGSISSLLFPPYRDLEKAYPVLEKCCLLLPFVWLFRTFVKVFGRMGLRIRQLGYIFGSDHKDGDAYNDEIARLGLGGMFE